MTWLVGRFALVLAIVPVWPSLQAPDRAVASGHHSRAGTDLWMRVRGRTPPPWRLAYRGHMSQHASHDLQGLRRRVGDVSQLVSTRAARLADGNEDGVRVIDARAAGGISALILADRGLDIGPLWAGGHQVSWQSTTGAVHPAYFHEADWLRSFHGGMLITCGLQNVGLPSEDEGTSHGLHGRISNVRRSQRHPPRDRGGRPLGRRDHRRGARDRHVRGRPAAAPPHHPAHGRDRRACARRGRQPGARPRRADAAVPRQPGLPGRGRRGGA